MEDKREYNIDIFRILATFFVVALHVLKHGGILEGLGYISISYVVAWGIELCAVCAVNCYGLISGYVGLNSRHKLQGIIKLWFDVFFYSFVIYIVMTLLFARPFSINEFISYIFPITSYKYWYFSCYFIVFFLGEGLSKVVNNLEKNKVKLLLIVLFLFFSLIPTVLNQDIFWTINGNGVLWLLYLYLVGSYFKKYGFKLLKSLNSIILYFIFVIVGGLIRSILAVMALQDHAYFNMGLQWTNYTSPLVFGCAICLLAFFANTKFKMTDKMKKIVLLLSSSSFGIYLIHDHPLVRELLITRKFKYLTLMPVLKMTLMIFISIIGIYSICLLIDVIKKKLLKVLNIEKIINKVENSINSVVEKV